MLRLKNTPSKNKYKKSVFFHILIQLFSFIVSIILIKLIEPEIFGIFAMVAPVLGLVSLFISFGTSSAIISKRDLSIEELSTLFWTKMSLAILLGLIIIISARIISNFYAEPKLTLLLYFFSLNLVFVSGSQVFQGLLNRYEKFNSLANVDLYAFIISSAIAIVLALQGYGISALLAKELSMTFIVFILSYSYAQFRPITKFNYSKIKYFYRFGRNTTSTNFIYFISRNLDDVLIGRKYGSSDLGLYSKAYSLLTLPNKLITGLAYKFTLPKMAQYEDIKDSITLYKMVSKIVFTINLPFAVLIFFTCDYFVPLIFGESWNNMIPFMKLFSALSIFQATGALNKLIYLGRNKTDELLKYESIINFIIILALLIGFYASSTAFSLALIYCVTSMILFLPSKLFLAMTANIKVVFILEQYIESLIAMTLAIIILLVVVYFFEPNNIYLIITFRSSLILGLYFLFLYFINPSSFMKMKQKIFLLFK